MQNLAKRVDRITPFYVMELVKQASALQASGHDIIHMSIGEPDFTALPAVVEAAARVAQQGKTQYTPALGIEPLRQAIADHYRTLYQANVDPEQVIVTSGASGALQLACQALVNPDDQILLPDPCYPCNRHFVTAAGGKAVLVPTTPAQRFQLDLEHIQQHWNAQTKGVLIATPSNPTGTSVNYDTLKVILTEVQRRQGVAIIDEIYLGLSYNDERRSAHGLIDDLVIVNSFSKYFHMTGWRLGWLIVPKKWLSAFERLAQNLVICPNAIAQYAALECFRPESIAQFEQRRQAFQQRRDYLLPEFERLGLNVPVRPDGAFYIYTDISRFSDDSFDFARRMLQDANVCAVPGLDFGDHLHHRYIRFSYANSMDRLQEAVHRLSNWLV